jgi:hypothetical protein
MSICKKCVADKAKERYNKKEKIKESTVRWAKTRKDVITFLGGKCCRCGFDDFRALQIDHVNGHGCADRKKDNNNYYAFYKRIIDTNGEGYQLLCANCNWIKRTENNECARKHLTP